MITEDRNNEKQKSINLHGGGGGRPEPFRVGFTMAEILLSLTIIGVVAAITLPSLTGNINERTWNTQRKALYARFSQAIALMPALNGYGTLTESESHSITADTAAETFVTDGLSKVLKINNICDSEHLADCGLPDKIIPLQLGAKSTSTLELGNIKTLVSFNNMFNGSFTNPATLTTFTYSQTDTKAAAFETVNGESILVYYNPNCVGKVEDTGSYWTQPRMCANFVYDLNGNKGPNTVGKDIGFLTAMYASDPVVVAPQLMVRAAATSVKQKDAGRECQKLEAESRVPNRDEAAAIFYNKQLLGLTNSDYIWTSSVKDVNNGWHLSIDIGKIHIRERDLGLRILCVAR